MCYGSWGPKTGYRLFVGDKEITHQATPSWSYESCRHEYVEVGFVLSKIVCKKCNKEKVDENEKG